MSTTLSFQPAPLVSGTTVNTGGYPTAVPTTAPTSGATSIDWGRIVNTGFDLGAQVAANVLAKNSAESTVLVPVQSDTAAARAAAAGSGADVPSAAVMASRPPAWLWPVVGIVGVIGLLGMFMGFARK